MLPRAINVYCKIEEFLYRESLSDCRTMVNTSNPTTRAVRLICHVARNSIKVSFASSRAMCNTVYKHRVHVASVGSCERNSSFVLVLLSHQATIAVLVGFCAHSTLRMFSLEILNGLCRNRIYERRLSWVVGLIQRNLIQLLNWAKLLSSYEHKSASRQQQS